MEMFLRWSIIYKFSASADTWTVGTGWRSMEEHTGAAAIFCLTILLGVCRALFSPWVLSLELPHIWSLISTDRTGHYCIRGQTALPAGTTYLPSAKVKLCVFVFSPKGFFCKEECDFDNRCSLVQKVRVGT